MAHTLALTPQAPAPQPKALNLRLSAEVLCDRSAILVLLLRKKEPGVLGTGVRWCAWVPQRDPERGGVFLWTGVVLDALGGEKCGQW